MNIVRVFAWGLFISLLGSLPLGSLNVMAFKVYIEESLTSAIYFSIGVAIIEVVYVRISLIGMNWVMRNRKFFKIMEWATVGLFIGLAIATYLAAGKEMGEVKKSFASEWPPFLRGIVMSAINPVQIPFWFLWSTYLVSNNRLMPNVLQYNWYCGGIGIGTLLGLALYMFGGKWLVSQIGANQQEINYFVALVFLITALLQLYKILAQKDKLQSAELQEKLSNFNQRKQNS